MQILPERTKKLRKALLKKDLSTLGELIEKEALELHTIAMTSSPPIFYLKPKTWEIINRVKRWRDEGLSVYFTLDAGPNIHLICHPKDKRKILQNLGKVRGIEKVIANKSAIGARLVN